jgi:AhpD family alkylhydroperoxidase
MARISIPEIKSPDGIIPESHRLMLLNKDMGKALSGLSQAIYEKSPLDKRVREAVRMRIAQINQCLICLGFRFPELQALGVDEAFYSAVADWRNSAIFSDKEKLAIEYSELFAQNHLSINDAFFARLRQHFSDEEIFVLTGTIAGLIANGRMMQVLQVEQSCEIT